MTITRLILTNDSVIKIFIDFDVKYELKVIGAGSTQRFWNKYEVLLQVLFT